MFTTRGPLFALFLVCGQALVAAPPAGTYELYNGAGQKTGVISSQMKQIGTESELTITTRLEIPGVLKTYRFTEIDRVVLSASGVISFRRDTDEEGKKSFSEGNRDADNFVVRTDRNGVKMVTAFPLSSFDITEFEIDLPASSFRTLKPGQSKSKRILYFDRLAVVKVSRNVGEQQSLPTNDGEAPVLVLHSVVQGKPVTSWFHARTGELLQEEGTDYLMTRVFP